MGLLTGKRERKIYRGPGRLERAEEGMNKTGRLQMKGGRCRKTGVWEGNHLKTRARQRQRGGNMVDQALYQKPFIVKINIQIKQK